jgi:hypothetical protein
MSAEQPTDQTDNEQPSVGFYIFLGVITLALLLMVGYLVKSYL